MTHALFSAFFLNNWVISCLWPGAKKVIFKLAIRACCTQHLLARTPFQLAPKTFWWAELISQFFCNIIWIPQKNYSCPSGKLRTEFTGPIAKSTTPMLSDTTFSACWCWLVESFGQWECRAWKWHDGCTINTLFSACNFQKT